MKLTIVATTACYLFSCRTETRIEAFTPSSYSKILPHQPHYHQRHGSIQYIPQSSHLGVLHMSSASTLPDIGSMRVSELKKELESYGISTKSFFEKSELVEAVEKARAEGKTPISSKPDSEPDPSSAASSSSSSSSTTDANRDEKIVQEMEKCKQMKASELKAELESYGISTASFFEKSEFVKACAEARVDGVTKKSSSSSGGENYAEYADVEVLTDDSSGPRKRSTEQSQNDQGGNPFGGGVGANPFGGMGGMGGMGGIADMMKNMGMGGMGGPGAGANPFGGGGAGANPFGGAGAGAGNPFGGDTMKKAQEMMSNPKVREIIMKAQSNPKVMKAVQECMSNPAAFTKYQNDPEVGELIRELQKYM